jgi:hypothetical protein
MERLPCPGPPQTISPQYTKLRKKKAGDHSKIEEEIADSTF